MRRVSSRNGLKADKMVVSGLVSESKAQMMVMMKLGTRTDKLTGWMAN